MQIACGNGHLRLKWIATCVVTTCGSNGSPPAAVATCGFKRITTCDSHLRPNGFCATCGNMPAASSSFLRPVCTCDKTRLPDALASLLSYWVQYSHNPQYALLFPAPALYIIDSVAAATCG
jgi:hypothetical protein